jgi:hypothetical protein
MASAVVLAYAALRPLLSMANILEVSGVIVGVLGGLWFKREGATRDQLVFLTGAVLLLFSSTLEYDHRLFANITKFGGGEFSVEFQSNIANNDSRTVVPPVTPQQGDLRVLFPGASGLDFAVGSLIALPQNIVNDERYAQFFSTMSSANNDPIVRMPYLTRQFLYYACATISPYARKLDTLQSRNRSETSVLSASPELVSALRAMYYTARERIDSAEQNFKLSATLINLGQEYIASRIREPTRKSRAMRRLNSHTVSKADCSAPTRCSATSQPAT